MKYGTIVGNSTEMQHATEIKTKYMGDEVSTVSGSSNYS